MAQSSYTTSRDVTADSGVDANEPFGGSQPLLTIKRLSNAAMNAAIFWATKNPPL
jgi:hypothetical protein